MAAGRFVVIADSSKTVERLTAPLPLELSAFGLAATLTELVRVAGRVELRDVPRSPDGGVIADYLGEVGDPAATCRPALGHPRRRRPRASSRRRWSARC